MTFSIGEVEVTNEVSLAANSSLYDGAVVADDDLTVKVNSFYYDIAGTKGKYAGSCGNVVENNQTNYVYLSSVGALVINKTGYAAGTHLRLARVVASNGFIIKIILERALLSTAPAGSLQMKAGRISSGSFAGTPMSASVTFSTPYDTNDYAASVTCTVSGTSTFALALSSQTVAGFTVNIGSNAIDGLQHVNWITTMAGE